ncbi:MAG: hypothetical protein NXH85_00320 [Pseudomonadaceae bacterium]|nr:hypothetical protein [Pseudomonadaceae bacterium]
MSHSSISAETQVVSRVEADKSRASFKAIALSAACVVGLISGPGLAADNVKHIVKKTMDGRCLSSDHPSYWDTKIYIKKASMQACVASGGKQDRA